MTNRNVGQIVQINLSNGYHGFGCNLQNGVVAVYDAHTTSNLSIDAIKKRPVLFCVSVVDKGYEKWKKIGLLDNEEYIPKTPQFFVQDVWDLENIQIVNPQGYIHSVDFSKVQNLERAVAWDYYQVEQRIQDHYTNKTNWMVEYYRPKPPTAPHFRPTERYSPQPGVIKRIDLGDSTYVYGRELPNTFIAVYDLRTTNNIPPDHVIKSHVLFIVSTSLSARLGWPDVGFEPLNPDEYPLPERYMIGDPAIADLTIYDGNLNPRSASLDEIVGLEPAVMWDNYHIENRVRSYYEGNPWLF